MYITNYALKHLLKLLTKRPYLVPPSYRPLSNRTEIEKLVEEESFWQHVYHNPRIRSIRAMRKRRSQLIRNLF